MIVRPPRAKGSSRMGVLISKVIQKNQMLLSMLLAQSQMGVVPGRQAQRCHMQAHLHPILTYRKQNIIPECPSPIEVSVAPTQIGFSSRSRISSKSTGKPRKALNEEASRTAASRASQEKDAFRAGSGRCGLTGVQRACNTLHARAQTEMTCDNARNRM
jgi:hypothetical protein